MREQNKNLSRRMSTSLFLSAGILLGSAVVPFESIGLTRAEASAVNFETTANLNMRVSASTKASIILTVPKGRQVSYVTRDGAAWYKVKYGTKEGWVSSSYLKAVVATAKPKVPATVMIANSTTQASYQTTANLNLRSSASTKGKILVTIPKGKEITYIAKSGSWFNVKYGTQTGWVSASYVKIVTKAINPVTSSKPTPAPTPVPAPTTIPTPNPTISVPPIAIVNLKWMTTGNLNLRDSTSVAGNVVTTIPKGVMLTSLSESGGWHQVSYGGQTGFVSGEYLYMLTKENADKIEALEKKPYILMDLRTKSSVTANQINQYLVGYGKATAENSILYNTGQLFIDAANKYGLNALYLAAHAIHESNFGKSQISLAKNNLFGFGAYDLTPFVGAVKFDSVKSNIDYIAQEMKATYLNPNNWKHQGTYLGYTIKDSNGARNGHLSKGMNFYYASDSNWGNAIANHMERILPSSQEIAINQSPNTQVPVSPGYPNGKDVFPAGTSAIANSAIALYEVKGGTNAVATIQKSETFNLLEKWNDYWLTVQYNGRTYYTNKVSFSKYNQHFTVKNLARVNANALNVRDSASTSGGVIGTLPNYQYVELVVDVNTNMPITINGWYNVRLDDGTLGWVSGAYLIQELNR